MMRDDIYERAVAIVGVGAVLPDAPDAKSFWQNICGKRYSITDVPDNRWKPLHFYDTDRSVPDKTYSKIGGFVTGFNFDWKKYRIPPKVADMMDEVQQWALVASSQALEDYGYPNRPLDTDRVGVILGTAMGGDLHLDTHARVLMPEFIAAIEKAPEFAAMEQKNRAAIIATAKAELNQRFPEITEDTMPGELSNVVSGRVANVLNLRGPNFITDAACASSLAAISSAVRLLQDGQMDAVLTGGADRNMAPSTFVKFSKIGALSATGSRPFGEGADGFVMGEGCAIFLMKRLADAERDGDKIYAVLRGIGSSSDGRGKGITAPNPVGQELAIKRAWEDAELPPETATLVEAHGTSTSVGDAVEFETLSKMFANAPKRSIALGSAKSNIGHLKAAAGAAGVLKAALALHEKVLPPTLNAEPASHSLKIADSPFFLSHNTQPWAPKGDVPRRAGVSSYGFGGTNFHLVFEEHAPHALKRRIKPQPSVASATNATPLRGILALGASNKEALAQALDTMLQKVAGGYTPPRELPSSETLRAPERLVVDFGDAAELTKRLSQAQKAMTTDNDQLWSALTSQGVFRGRGTPQGKMAFLFPGQGSQYINMGRELAAASPVVKQTFVEADAIMKPILGKPLTDYIFVDAKDDKAVAEAERSLTDTAITQPAVLTLDTAIFKLLGSYGLRPDVVMGHSLGEYGALIAAEVMPFAHALEATAARGREMSHVNVEDKGWMAAVFAPFELVERVLQSIDGYVVAANINSPNQCVIGGASKAVEQAIAVFAEQGFRAQRLQVSHAFHTSIVAPASGPLREVLDRLTVQSPTIPLVGNVLGALYPNDPQAIKDLLERQIASPVQWYKGLQTLYAQGVRTFVEVGPKKALRGLVEDSFKGDVTVTSLFTNHPKVGEVQSFNQALCGLFAAGIDPRQAVTTATSAHTQEPSVLTSSSAAAVAAPVEASMSSSQSQPAHELNMTALAQVLAQALRGNTPATTSTANTHETAPSGSVVISGTGLGLPGGNKPLMDPDNALRLLRGEQFIDLIPARFRTAILDKQITRLVKAADGTGSFELLADADVIKLAGRPGHFDFAAEYGAPTKLVEALDITTQMAMAAGLDALREAGVPLVRTYRKASNGKMLPDRWMLPESLRDETGIIFASAFPGYDRMLDEMERYFAWQDKQHQIDALEAVASRSQDPSTLADIQARILNLRDEMARAPYTFDRRFLFRVLAMGHSQFAEYIGARGPNTQINSACASTTQAMSIAEDWIRSGRVRRVLVVAADCVTGDKMLEWVAAGFQAMGAAATEDKVELAALPFDRRRHGMLLGMGAAALVLEAEDALRERGMRGIVEVLATESRNSAYHGSRLDTDHIGAVMNSLVTTAEQRFGLNRYAMAAETVFVSHETYTPARGGSAAAEVIALRSTFGETASHVVVANTKGFTGHAMAVGIEDVAGVKMLEHGMVPPVPNHKEIDPDLGPLNLSRGGRYPIQYALRLAAGFGSQISMSLLRRVPGSLDRIDDRTRYNRWLTDISGQDMAMTEVQKRVLRVVDAGAPSRPPAPSAWRQGQPPTVRANFASSIATVMPTARASQAYAAPAIPIQTTKVPTSYAPVSAPMAAPIKAEVLAAAYQAAMPVAPTPAPIAAQPKAAGADEIVTKVMQIVSAKTGYPVDMLDLELHLEADLGVDTVKQAETFAEIRAAFNIPKKENLSLRDYPTLGKVVGFVRDSLGVTVPAVSAPSLPIAATNATVAAPAATPVSGAVSNSDLVNKVLSIVAAKTGYPMDMLDLELDMEADLGVDTVKQAETFAEIRTAFGIPKQENISLRNYPTLGKVVEFVKTHVPTTTQPVTTTPVPAPIPAASATPTAASKTAPAADSDDALIKKVLEIVAAKTGYPIDMLDLALDLEADLGVDTVKQAETFAEIRAAFGIPKQENLSLRNYPTLEKVVGFVRSHRPQAQTPTPEAKLTTKTEATTTAPSATKRREPVLVARPTLGHCKPTGVTLNGARVLVAQDQQGVAEKLCKALKKRGVDVLRLDPRQELSKTEAQLKEYVAGGDVMGVYWLAGLDADPALSALDLNGFKAEMNARVKGLHRVMQALYEKIAMPGRFLVAATRMGGMHGYNAEGAQNPMGGAVVGFVKAYKRERPEVLVKAVDVGVDADAKVLVETLLGETERDPGAVEIGYHDGVRLAVSVEERQAPQQSGLTLGKDSVVLVTGAAGGITSAITANLAQHGGTFYLLDLTAEPRRNHPLIATFKSDRNAAKATLIEAAKAKGEKPKPQEIDRELNALEREATALQAIEAIESMGGKAIYKSVNLCDAAAIATVMDEIRKDHGKLDLIMHAAGLEISRALPEKDAKQFDLVFDVKAQGWFNLLKAALDLPIGATVAFSSVAGRFGNAGQTDYSAANDMLCKWTSHFRTARPNTQGIVIDWTAWAGIGMATRGSIPTIMARAGIDMLPPEDGIPVVARELSHGTRGEVVVGGALGILTQEWDTDGGLATDVKEHAKGLAPKLHRTPLYGPAELEMTLDPKEQPFLFDHQVEKDLAYLPGVMGMEMFAQAAPAMMPGMWVTSIENVSFGVPFKFYRNEPRTLHLMAQFQVQPNGEVMAKLSLQSVTQPPKAGLPTKVAVHFTGEVRLSSRPAAAKRAEFKLPVDGASVSRDDIYRTYFHGPAYQVLERAELVGQQAYGLWPEKIPSDATPATEWLASPRLVELCFQTAGLWEISNKRSMALPMAVEHLSLYATPKGNARLWAQVDAVKNGESYNARVLDEAGHVYLEVKGYRTVPLAGETQLWPADATGHAKNQAQGVEV